MRLVVTGGRDFTLLSVIEGALRMADERYGIDVLIHGGAPGVDSLCADWAARNDKQVVTYPAKWDMFGKRAGIIRNEQMIVQGKPNRGLVFPGGKGTLSMHKLLIKYGVPFDLVEG